MKTEPIFILAGQSNMAGRCSVDDLPERYNPVHTLENLDVQLCWDNDHNLGEGCNSGGVFTSLQAQHSPGLDMDIWGPEMALAHSLAPRLQKRHIQRAYVIKFTMGSTNLYSNWNPSNTNSASNTTKREDIGYYPKFVQFCHDAIALIDEPKDPGTKTPDERITHPLWGMFWLQGESDSSKAKYANSYVSNFKHFASTFRNDLGTTTMPIVVSPIVWQAKKVGVVNDALRKVASCSDEGVENCVCIDPLVEDEHRFLHKEGMCAGHLMAAGLCEIGKRLGEAVPLPRLEGLETASVD